MLNPSILKLLKFNLVDTINSSFNVYRIFNLGRKFSVTSIWMPKANCWVITIKNGFKELFSVQNVLHTNLWGQQWWILDSMPLWVSFTYISGYTYSSVAAGMFQLLLDMKLIL